MALETYVNKTICKIKGHDWILEKENDYTRSQNITTWICSRCGERHEIKRR